MIQSQGVINPTTGFIEHPQFMYDFDSDRKLHFISLIEQGYGKYKACELLKIKAETVFKHLRTDQAFEQAVKDAEQLYFDSLEGLSRINALEPKMVIERIFQLKARFPEKYGDNKNGGNVNITLNIDGKLIESSLKRDQIINAEIIKDQEQRVLALNNLSEVKENNGVI